MSEHKYCKPGKFKNVNCPYAIVDGIVFNSIFEAEEFCTREGLDPNYCIESDSEEALKKCKETAAAALPVLYETRCRYQRIFHELLKDDSAKADAVNDPEKMKELGSSVYRFWLQEAQGKVSGFYMAMEDLNKQIEMLERINRIR